MKKKLITIFPIFIFFFLVASSSFATTLNRTSISLAECDPCFLNKNKPHRQAKIFFITDNESEEINKIKIQTKKKNQIFDVKSNDGEYPVKNFGEYDIHIIDLNGDDLFDFGIGIPSTPRNPRFLYFLYVPQKGNFVMLGEFGYLTQGNGKKQYLEKVTTPRYYDFQENYYHSRDDRLKLVKKRYSTVDHKSQLAMIHETKVINGVEKKIGSKRLPIKGSMLEKKYFDDLSAAHRKALNYFRKRNISKSINEMRAFFTKYEYQLIFFGDNLTPKKLNFINDYAYFLEQGKKYEESVQILNYIIKSSPERVVAYINLGDAYYGLLKKKEAKQAYQKYVNLMKKKRKERRIPKRVYTRLNK